MVVVILAVVAFLAVADAAVVVVVVAALLLLLHLLAAAIVGAPMVLIAAVGVFLVLFFCLVSATEYVVEDTSKTFDRLRALKVACLQASHTNCECCFAAFSFLQISDRRRQSDGLSSDVNEAMWKTGASSRTCG